MYQRIFFAVIVPPFLFSRGDFPLFGFTGMIESVNFIKFDLVVQIVTDGISIVLLVP